jgi:hypothetical protein
MESNSSLRDLEKRYSIKQFKKEEGLLYRYDSIDNAIKLLVNETIYLQSPNNYNDPYEFHEGFCIKDLINLDQFAARNEIDSVKLKKFLSFSYDEQTNLISDTIQRLRKDRGSYCLTKNKNDLLMWSHYANKHQGVSFGLDFCTELMVEKYNAILLSVGYIKNVTPLINFFIRDNPSEIMLWHFLKFEKWKDENEVRVYKNQVEATLKIDINHIKEVYLGCNITKENEDLILNIIHQKNLNPKVFKNKVSKYSFELESIEI